jgi:hypothetical protein
MSTFEGDGGPPGSRQEARGAPSDLMDFYRRWPEFRQTAEALAERPDLSVLERQTLYWLIQLANRVGEDDLALPKRP